MRAEIEKGESQSQGVRASPECGAADPDSARAVQAVRAAKEFEIDFRLRSCSLFPCPSSQLSATRRDSWPRNSISGRGRAPEAQEQSHHITTLTTSWLLGSFLRRDFEDDRALQLLPPHWTWRGPSRPQSFTPSSSGGPCPGLRPRGLRNVRVEKSDVNVDGLCCIALSRDSRRLPTSLDDSSLGAYLADGS